MSSQAIEKQTKNQLLSDMSAHDDGAADWVRALRATGAEIFENTGLPTPAWEDWKYTPLREFDRTGFVADMGGANAPVIDIADLPDKTVPDAVRMVFVNGQYQSGLSDDLSVLGADVVVTNLATEQSDWVAEYLVNVGDLADHPFKSLNTAMFSDGAIVRVPENVQVDRPLEILFFTQGGQDTPPAINPRHLIMVEDGAKLSLIEHHAGQGIYLANHMMEIVTKTGASLYHYRVQDESLLASHFMTLSLTQFRESVYEQAGLALGGKISVFNINSKLIEKNVSCKLKSSYAMRGVQHCNHTIKIDHFEPDGISDQIFRGIVDDQACAVFQGKIHVCRNAQGTDGCQSHHALLLSEKAEVFAKPELEIYADDVKCAHGATTGQLDEAALFYLRARGVPEKQARQILIKSYLGDAFSDLADDAMRDVFERRIDLYLGEENDG